MSRRLHICTSSLPLFYSYNSYKALCITTLPTPAILFFSKDSNMPPSRLPPLRTPAFVRRKAVQTVFDIKIGTPINKSGVWNVSFTPEKPAIPAQLEPTKQQKRRATTAQALVRPTQTARATEAAAAQAAMLNSTIIASLFSSPCPRHSKPGSSAPVILPTPSPSPADLSQATSIWSQNEHSFSAARTAAQIGDVPDLAILRKLSDIQGQQETARRKKISHEEVHSGVDTVWPPLNLPPTTETQPITSILRTLPPDTPLEDALYFLAEIMALTKLAKEEDGSGGNQGPSGSSSVQPQPQNPCGP